MIKLRKNWCLFSFHLNYFCENVLKFTNGTHQRNKRIVSKIISWKLAFYGSFVLQFLLYTLYSLLFDRSRSLGSSCCFASSKNEFCSWSKCSLGLFCGLLYLLYHFATSAETSSLSWGFDAFGFCFVLWQGGSTFALLFSGGSDCRTWCSFAHRLLAWSLSDGASGSLYRSSPASSFMLTRIIRVRMHCWMCFMIWCMAWGFEEDEAARCWSSAGAHKRGCVLRLSWAFLVVLLTNHHSEPLPCLPCLLLDLSNVSEGNFLES